MVISMEGLLLSILSEINSNIKTPFVLLDKHGQKIFGQDLKGDNISEKNIFLINKIYTLQALLPKNQLEDLCFFLEITVKAKFDRELAAFINGKNSILTDFPFPCGLALIQSEFLAEIEGFINTIFEEGMTARIDDILLSFLPMSNLDELKETSTALYQTIAEEVSQKAVISLGGIAHSQSELIRAFNDAKKALIFASRKNFGVLHYPEMALELLISLLPSEIRHNYKNEMEMNFKDLDSDTINTIRVFLDCNLHIAQAARHLYIHRNTLIYRLDKIYTITGLDLRNFNDAIKMKIHLILNDFF
ncbi:putative transcriptional regulator, PucR family [Tepidanaerobacter acetatoxydans Re1]|uniref:Putative transcriptional regulator, PucR family n=2 Tax=Tepidanaerobacter acetatoxydans TaxID=499229 RepID=F4LVS9_TEPAE|nr:putative transcriptional regulator, PucR family [Tepidanaerobacter acetatoxydans Re1]CDI40438.1 putative transcriptional regulator, PucR family [Tepidanaerobacter acetatoxydans Re1]